MRALILTPAPDFWEEWGWAYDVEAAALRAGGIAVEQRPWTDPGDLGGFDVVLPLVAWGYHLRFAEWCALLERMAQAGVPPMINPPALLRWNSDKAYLAELAAAGVPTVASRTVDALDEAALADARAAFGDELVIKPLVSASADGTYRLGAHDPLPAAVAGKRMLVQPFMASIASGEYSLMLFDGVFSHCIVKTPKPGDFRVQPHLGGTEEACAPPPGATALAQAALAAAPAPAVYARVDMVANDSGALQIMELELIEPALWLQHAPDKGSAFAAAIASAIRQQAR
jgi:glutathione synthase/RimK-type ligase-like ATP-grasp enzyme